jgi:hypothetical protein
VSIADQLVFDLIGAFFHHSEALLERERAQEVQLEFQFSFFIVVVEFQDRAHEGPPLTAYHTAGGCVLQREGARGRWPA